MRHIHRPYSHINAHTHTRIRKRTYTHACVILYAHSHKHARTWTHARAPACTHTHAHRHADTFYGLIRIERYWILGLWRAISLLKAGIFVFLSSLSLCLSVCLSVCISVRSVCLCVCLSISLPSNYGWWGATRDQHSVVPSSSSMGMRNLRV